MRKKLERKINFIIFSIITIVLTLPIFNAKNNNYSTTNNSIKAIEKELFIPEKKKYFAAIEIPDISLKEYLVDPNNEENKISKKIEIIKPSKMPDKKNSLLILAAHSGNSPISYFKNLNKLKINNLVYIYYNDVEYVYKVIKVENQNKNGQIFINKENNKSLLILTTCSQKDKSKQIVIISELK